jgi:hypothetical protein
MPLNTPSQGQISVANVSDRCIPGGAQLIVLGNMVFDGTGTITYQFSQAGVAFRNPSQVRALYFDARSLTIGDALIQFSGGPTLRLQFGKQGWLPVFMPGPVTVVMSSAAGNGPLAVYLSSFKVYPFVW